MTNLIVLDAYFCKCHIIPLMGITKEWTEERTDELLTSMGIAHSIADCSWQFGAELVYHQPLQY